MQAIVFTEYGSSDVLHLKEVEKPTPQENEVLIKVYASSINAAELHVVSGTPFPVRLMVGLRKPKKTIPGADVAGRVEAVGSNVTRFKVGDEVFGDLSGCGWGAYAEYVCASEDILVLKPANITFEQAAAVPLAAVTALQGLRKGNIQAGQKVLVNGAASGVGMFAVQIAKALGAEVTGVCSAKKTDMVRSLGADHVIDYNNEDFTQNGQQYDLILDIAAYRSVSDYKGSLTPTGHYVMIGGAMGRLMQAMIQGPLLSRGGQKFGNMLAHPDAKDLTVIKEWLETGKVVPFIDKSYPLSETAQAMRYVEDRHVHGKVVINMA